MIILGISVITFRIYSNIIYVLIIQTKNIWLSCLTILCSTWCPTCSSRSFCCCVISTATSYIILLVLPSNISILLLLNHFFIWICCIILIYIYCIEIISFLNSWNNPCINSIYCIQLRWILGYWSTLYKNSTSLMLLLIIFIK